MIVEKTSSPASKISEEEMKQEILRMKEEKGAVILAHYYQKGEIQDLADYIGDSLALAQIASKLDAPIIVLCGVHFMGETAKILCPDKKVLIPDAEAGCSLADSCDAKEFESFIAQHPDHTVISYVNTSAQVKALTDVLVTSSNAKKIVESFPKDEKIIFGPDKNLGEYINAATGRNMILWNGGCHVHARFSLDSILNLKNQYPNAKVLVHPECPAYIQKVADVIGSTAALLKYSIDSDAKEFIVATESGILHEMQKACPDKIFIPAPPETTESVGCSCNECSYMKLNTIEKLYNCLLHETPEIVVDEEIAEKARKPIQRMLQLS